MSQFNCKCFRFIYLFCFLVLLFSSKNAQAQSKDELSKILRSELTREMEELKSTSTPPYYMDYRVDDMQNASIKSSFGSLIESQIDKKRILTTRVRVGDYRFDNTHENSKFDANTSQRFSFPMMLPYEDSAAAIKHVLWESTQLNYRISKEMLTAIKSMRDSKVNPADGSLDFSRETPQQHYEPKLEPIEKNLKQKEWEERLKKYSALFTKNTDIVTAEVTLLVDRNRKYFENTEGTSIVQNERSCNLYIFSRIRTEDGDVLPMYKTYYASTPDSLPNDEVILQDIAALISKLVKLQHAPLADPFSGPAILNAKAAGVFFHEIFGHRIEGHRMKSEDDGQTFLNKVNQRILLKSLSVYCDPTLSEYAGSKLNGHYVYDDEGVLAQKVTVVENGVLKNFLMSRSPIGEFSASNGHGRTAAGGIPVSRQSNLIIKSNDPISENDLRKRLIKECKKQKKEYGYLFENVEGGFTNTARFTPNAFNIFPTEVYRIYVDGRPDELVRGVNLIGTPLSMFAEVEAASDKSEIFIGMCGAESGSVPVSVVCPSIFVKRIETQKSLKANLERKILPSPSIEQN